MFWFTATRSDAGPLQFRATRNARSRANRALTALAAVSIAVLTGAALYSQTGPAVVLVSMTGSGRWPGRPGQLVEGRGASSVVQLHGDVHQAVIGPVSLRNAYRAVDTMLSSTVSNLVIDGVSAEVRGGCIRTRGAQILIRNTRCAMTNGPQFGDVNMPFGLQVTSGRDIRVENSRFDGFQWRTAPWRYWNGEGISIERGVVGVAFRNVSADANTDAGFDIKPFVTLDNVSARGNCRNFRFWSGARAGTLISGDTVKRGGISSCSALWLNGSQSLPHPRLQIARLVVRFTRPGDIIVVENGAADIEIGRCEIQAPAKTQLVRFTAGRGEVKLGPGCGGGLAG